MVLLIRHGATEGNLLRRYVGGRTDEGLCGAGIEQVGRLRSALDAAGLPRPDRVIASPMRRCLETAAILYPGARPEVVDALREMDFGALEGRTHAEMEADPAYRAWVDGEGRAPLPGGEPRERFDARCVGAFRALGPLDGAAIVAHGGTVMSILSALGADGLGYYGYHLGNAEAYACKVEAGRLKVVLRVRPSPRAAL